MKSYKNIDEYIKSFPKEVQVKLKEFRLVIKKTISVNLKIKNLKVEEAIKYGIPTLRLNNKNIVHFGGFKSHVSFFPGSEPIEYFKKDLLKYETSKGTIKFNLDKKLPVTLIAKITKFRVTQLCDKMSK